MNCGPLVTIRGKKQTKVASDLNLSEKSDKIRRRDGMLPAGEQGVFGAVFKKIQFSRASLEYREIHSYKMGR